MPQKFKTKMGKKHRGNSETKLGRLKKGPHLFLTDIFGKII